MSKRRSGVEVSTNANSKKKRQSSLTAFMARKGAGDEDESQPSSEWSIYCDMDGVLCDFDAGVRKLLGKDPEELENPGRMWSAIASTGGFYSNLPWTRDGKELWDAIKELSPDILTGVPKHRSARVEKAIWCQRELFGVKSTNHVDMAAPKKAHEPVSGSKRKGVVNVITCWSRNKHEESRPKAILIDDREQLADQWRTRGGIFILHINTAQTLRELKKHGVLTTDEDDIQEKKSSAEPVQEEKKYGLPPDTP